VTKAEFSASLVQSSASHDPSKIKYADLQHKKHLLLSMLKPVLVP